MPCFKPGETISNAEPFVHVLNYSEKGLRCDYCFCILNTSAQGDDEGAQKHILCNGCDMMRYCSPACANLDLQRFHAGLECEYYKLIRSKARAACFLNTPRLILRLYFLVCRDPGIQDRPIRLYDDGLRALSNLLSHESDLANDPKRKKLFDGICSTLQTLQIGFDRSLLFRLFGQTFINAFTIFDQSSGSLVDIGRGLYLEASVFDHSCKPNATYFFDGIRLRIVASQLIDAEREPIFINYLNQNLPHADRRLYLQRQYYFTCKCELCVQEERKAESKDGRMSRDNLIRRICALFYSY